MSKFFLHIICVPLVLVIAGFTSNSTPERVSNEELRYMGRHLSTVPHFGFDLDFCGEFVPTENTHIREKLDHEIKDHVSYPTGTRLVIKRANRYRGTLTRILRERGIPEDFFYLAIAESKLSNAISHRGACGFWQFMEHTARGYGLEVSETVDERFHPEKATYAACRYFRQSYRIFNNWTLVAASYNMGMSGLRRETSRQQSNNYYELDLNRETSQYMYRVLSYKSVIEAPHEYGIRTGYSQNYPPIRFRAVTVNHHIPDLDAFARTHGTTYELLKRMNPWLISDHLVAKPGKTYQIRIPLSRDVAASELDVASNNAPQRLQMIKS